MTDIEKEIAEKMDGYFKSCFPEGSPQPSPIQIIETKLGMYAGMVIAFNIMTEIPNEVGDDEEKGAKRLEEFRQIMKRRAFALNQERAQM